MSTTEAIQIIKQLPVGERLRAVKEILRSVREETEQSDQAVEAGPKAYPVEAALELAGLFTDEDAREFIEALKDTNPL